MTEPGSWRRLAQEASIDPNEVRLVYERYDAYREFTSRSGAPLPLEQWFRFYHREKSSEGIQAGPPPSGCSADGDAVNDGCLKRPAEFLQVLIAYRNAGGTTG